MGAPDARGKLIFQVGLKKFIAIRLRKDSDNGYNAMGLVESLGYYRDVIDALKFPLRT